MTDLEFFELLLINLKWNQIVNYPNEELDYRFKLDELNKIIIELENKKFQI